MYSAKDSHITKNKTLQEREEEEQDYFSVRVSVSETPSLAQGKNGAREGPNRQRQESLANFSTVNLEMCKKKKIQHNHWKTM